MYSCIKKLRFQKTVSIVITLSMILFIWGCRGSSSKKKVGSLIKTYTVIDDKGRKSGKLILDPTGGAELRDTDGTVIGRFAPASQSQQPSKESSD